MSGKQLSLFSISSHEQCGLQPIRDHPCIYAIVNLNNNKRYIGSASHFYSRRAVHKQRLRENNHHSPHLQSAWNLYGEQSIRFIVIEFCTKAELVEREQYWIDFYHSVDPACGYNVLPNAASWLGMKHSNETKAKLSRVHKGWKMSPEHKQKLIEVNSRPLPEWRRIMLMGERNPNAKLTNDDVRRIKRLLADGHKVMRLAEEYKVTYSCIWKIKKEKKWTHVTDY